MGWRVLAMFGRARSSWLFLAFRVCALCFLSCEMQLRKFNAIIVGFALSMYGAGACQPGLSITVLPLI